MKEGSPLKAKAQSQMAGHLQQSRKRKRPRAPLGPLTAAMNQAQPQVDGKLGGAVRKLADGSATIEEVVAAASVKLTMPQDEFSYQETEKLQRYMEDHRKEILTVEEEDKALCWTPYDCGSTMTGNKAIKRLDKALQRKCTLFRKVVKDGFTKWQVRSYKTMEAASTIHQDSSPDGKHTKLCKLLGTLYKDADSAGALQFSDGDATCNLDRAHGTWWLMDIGLTNNLGTQSTRKHQRLAGSPGISVIITLYEHPTLSIRERLVNFGFSV